MRSVLVGATIFWSCTALGFCGAAPTDFDMAAFRQHAGELHHQIVNTPTCGGRQGVYGQFVMETPQQEAMPFSATTIVGARGIFTNLTTPGDTALSDSDAADVGKVFNDQAQKLVSKIIADCTGENT